MTNVPAFRVQIDDEELKAFRAEYAKFSEEAERGPEAWKNANEQIAKVRENFERMNEALEAGDGKADSIDKASRKASERSLFAWSSLSAGAASFGKSISRTTDQLKRWGKLSGLITGLLGAGGLYGINTLASQVSERRSRAMGSNMGYGESTAFESSFSRLGNTAGIMHGITDAATDPLKRQPLASLGINPTNKSTGQIFLETLSRIKPLVDEAAKNPDTFSNRMGPYHLDQLGMDNGFLRRLAEMKPQELEELKIRFSQNSSEFELPADLAKRWTDFETQLDVAGTRLQTVIGDRLVNITPGLTKLSDNVVKLFDMLIKDDSTQKLLTQTGTSLQDFADMIGSSHAMQDIDKFMSNFKMTAHDFKTINSWIASHSYQLKGLFGALVGARAGSVLGPAGMAAGVVIGNFVGKRGVITDGGLANGQFGPMSPQRDRQAQVQREAGARAERSAIDAQNHDVELWGLKHPNEPYPAERKGKVNEDAQKWGLGHPDKAYPGFDRDRSKDPPSAPSDGPDKAAPDAPSAGPDKAADSAPSGGDGRFSIVGKAKAQGADRVDPVLIEANRAASANLPPGYKLEMYSGYRPGDPRFHGRGMAADFAIIGPDGKKLANYKNPENFRPYEKLAQDAHRYIAEHYPDKLAEHRFGGYNGPNINAYGADDLMHQDMGGKIMPQSAGNWSEGLFAHARGIYDSPESPSIGLGHSGVTTARKNVVIDRGFMPAGGSHDEADGPEMAGWQPSASAGHSFPAAEGSDADWIKRGSLTDEQRSRLSHILYGVREGLTAEQEKEEMKKVHITEAYVNKDGDFVTRDSKAGTEHTFSRKRLESMGRKSLSDQVDKLNFLKREDQKSQATSKPQFGPFKPPAGRDTRDVIVHDHTGGDARVEVHH